MKEKPVLFNDHVDSIVLLEQYKLFVETYNKKKEQYNKSITWNVALFSVLLGLIANFWTEKSLVLIVSLLGLFLCFSNLLFTRIAGLDDYASRILLITIEERLSLNLHSFMRPPPSGPYDWDTNMMFQFIVYCIFFLLFLTLVFLAGSSIQCGFQGTL